MPALLPMARTLSTPPHGMGLSLKSTQWERTPMEDIPWVSKMLAC